MNTETTDNRYILEVSWGCPSKEYPVHGVFQFDQTLALHEAGESVVFLALDLRSIRKWRSWGINRRTYRDIPVYEYNFPCGPMPPNIKYPIQDRGFRRAIRAITDEFGKPSVIHVHTCQQAISAVEWCSENGVPYIITEHITPLDEGAAIEARKKAALEGAKAVIAVSSALGRDIKRVYGVDSVTIPNIVDLSEFRYIPRDGENSYTHSYSLAERGDADSRVTQILSAASMNHGKGFDVLIQAYANLVKTHPDTRLTIMGDGPEKDNIIRMASELGISDKVTFTGSYVRGEFAAQLTQTDFFVLPSRSETFGLVYAEALASGVPVVATRCGGPEDFVDESNGILVPVDDAGALTEAMEQMMAEAGRFDAGSVSMKCKNRFSPDVIAEQILHIIQPDRKENGI